MHTSHLPLSLVFCVLVHGCGCGASAPSATGVTMPGNGETREEIEAYVDAHLRLGFESTEVVADGAQDLFGSDDGYPGHQFVESAVQRVLAALIREQSTWQRPTDAERLDRAFRDLEEMGILARHCYAPTRSWAAGDLNEEAALARSRGVPVRGRVFYTSQDAEGLLDGQLHLAWGIYTEPGRTFAEDMDAADELAESVTSVLTRVGLNPIWDGSGSSTIVITDLHWRHPRDPETGRPMLSTERRYQASEGERADGPNAETPPAPMTANGEWLIKITYLSNSSDNGPYANLLHLHGANISRRIDKR